MALLWIRRLRLHRRLRRRAQIGPLTFAFPLVCDPNLDHWVQLGTLAS